MPLDQAVVDAGAVRFRPMLLTALAVVVGASVILADPIFQGLAISLMAGEIASLLISRMAVPVLYYIAYATPGAGQPVKAELPAVSPGATTLICRIAWDTSDGPGQWATPGLSDAGAMTLKCERGAAVPASSLGAGPTTLKCK